MRKTLTLSENAIEKLLNTLNIKKPENVDMYFKIIDFKLLDMQNNLYICTLTDQKSYYDKFILKNTKIFEKDSIIHVKKVIITLVNNDKIISCLNYKNFGVIKFDGAAKKEQNDIEKKEKKEKEIKEEKERDKKILDEELNKETILLFQNIKYEKRKKKYFFKWDNGNLKLINAKTNKEKNLSVKKSPKKSKIGKKQDNNFNILDNIENVEDYNNKKEEEEKKEKKGRKDNKVYNDDDEEETEKIFEGINVNELFKINQKKVNRQKDLKKDYQLFVNLSTFNKLKPLYTKCINKQLIIKEKQKYIVYIFRDPDGGEINAYVYDNDIVAFDKKILENEIYIISNYILKPKIYSTFINNDYRLILNKDTEIEPMPQDSVFNKIQFHFFNINELYYFKEGLLVDICGIIYDEGKIEIIKTKYGTRIIRNILICDTSKKKIYISLWEPHANNKRIKFEKGEIIAIKYCKVILYPEKIKKLTTISLSILQNSTSNYEKDLELKEFKEKYDSINNFTFVFNPPNYKYLNELKSHIKYNLQNNIDNCNISFVTKAYIDEIIIDNNSIYNGCPFCHRKLTEIEENNNHNKNNIFKFKCLFCKKNFQKPKYILKLSFRARDIYDKVFFNMIGEIASKFLNIDPDIIKEYLDDNNKIELKTIEERVLFQEYIFMGKLISYAGFNGKIQNKARIDNWEKADGDNLKKIIELLEENED